MLSRRPESLPCTNTRCHFKTEQDTVCPASTNSDVRGCCLAQGCDTADQLLWQDTGIQNLQSPCRYLQSPLPPSVVSVLSVCKGEASHQSPADLQKYSLVIRCYLTERSDSIITFSWPASFECFVLTKNRSYYSVI